MKNITMRVLPCDTPASADARTQTRQAPPTAREARLALKKFTAECYQKINQELSDPGKSKMVFISLLAEALFAEIRSCRAEGAASEDYGLISRELLGDDADPPGCRELFQAFGPLLPAFKEFTLCCAEYVDDILSWAYQYVNKLSLDSGLEKTQFFTETYMIEYLTRDIPPDIGEEHIYLDPACGGGNFLSHILDKLYRANCKDADCAEDSLKDVVAVLYGYELDPHLAMVAAVNLKLKALSLLSAHRGIQAADWDLFCPNIFTSETTDSFGFLEADFEDHMVRRVGDGQRKTMSELTELAAAIYTNPPFQTVKRMPAALKHHLKEHFPDSKCDLCHAFILQCLAKIKRGGSIGLVTQSSWMYLDSYEKIRRRIVQSAAIEALADLGSGAFYDLNGEKANVALLKLKAVSAEKNRVKVLSLREMPREEKIARLSRLSAPERLVEQEALFEGERFAFSFHSLNGGGAPCGMGKYGDYGIPMQGTSTGKASELIAYYWEHLDDPEWAPVSKGGGYSRWCGLNTYVLKWGRDGEYIRATPGSALRNTKYFDRTSLVYSDTGTSGFNARLLERNQLFVASGPGIRDIVGDPFAHLALLNSRLFSYYLRSLSPKLTVAAGYISRIPVPANLLEDPELGRLGRECYDRKREHLKVRPNNMEWEIPQIKAGTVRDYAAEQFQKEMCDELEKLICEARLDSLILQAYSLGREETERLNALLISPAAAFTGRLDASETDRIMAGALDTNGRLTRTRISGQVLGCDGVLEFAARREHADPKAMVEQIKADPAAFKQCLDKYTELCLHSIVLGALGFRQHGGPILNMEALKESFFKRYPSLKQEWQAVEGWIGQRFNAVHAQAFSARPYYRYGDGTFEILY